MAGQTRACILVVDDDDAIRRMIQATLLRVGYEVCEARNGREALEIMRAGESDLVVLDLMMPEVTGWDVLDARAADETLRKIPVIVASACRGPEVGAALSGGICALLPKPFELDTLRALVTTCLSHPHGAAAH
jgi:CheY-like chemotaxis protein